MIKKQPVNAKGQTEEEFLKAYDAGRYPCPALSVDMLIFSKYENRLKLLLIRRKNHPYIQQWALPGGFLNIGEDILDAAYRELKEETSIERNQVQLYQLHTYGAVHRDPRMRVVSVAHVALINQDVKVEAKESMPVWKHTGLACFDHNQKMQSIIGYISGFALFIVE